MKIKIGKFDCTECWDGVFYKKLSDFPKITDWEIQTILDFISYEKLYAENVKQKRPMKYSGEFSSSNQPTKNAFPYRKKLPNVLPAPLIKAA